jgi:hypothetical protein
VPTAVVSIVLTARSTRSMWPCPVIYPLRGC